MDQSELERLARKSGKTPREYCLSKIDEWKELLDGVSEDYRGLDEDQFDELVEREVDSLRRNQDQ